MAYNKTVMKYFEKKDLTTINKNNKLLTQGHVRKIVDKEKKKPEMVKNLNFQCIKGKLEKPALKSAPSTWNYTKVESQNKKSKTKPRRHMI